MKWFEKYSSNTVGGSGSQSLLFSDGEVHTGRVYFRVRTGGTFGYSLLYTNIIDGTIADGAVSARNAVCDEWEIVKLSVGVCGYCGAEEAGEPAQMLTVCENRRVAPGEFVTTEPVTLTAEKGEYVCVEMTFRGTVLPSHMENQLPSFVLEDGQWKVSQAFPYPSMLGCDRPVRLKLGFIGDSITQGIGTPVNAYAFWVAKASDALDDDVACWNLGLGYGRAEDAATNSAWLFKAKQVDAIVVGFGTNDIGWVGDEAKLKRSLEIIVSRLKEAGVKVLAQTLPPFHRGEKQLVMWRNVNEFILNELEADMKFNVTPLLEDPEIPGYAPYGDHPGEEGCAIWAKGLIPVLKEFVK